MITHVDRSLTIGSVVRKPYPGWSLLAGMAGAVSAVTKGLAVDLRPTRVNVVAPGLVDTEVRLYLPLLCLTSPQWS